MSGTKTPQPPTPKLPETPSTGKSSAITSTRTPSPPSEEEHVSPSSVDKNLALPSLFQTTSPTSPTTMPPLTNAPPSSGPRDHYGSTPGRGRKSKNNSGSSRKYRSGRGRGYWGGGHNLFYDASLTSSPVPTFTANQQYGTISPMIGNSPMLGAMASPKAMMSSLVMDGSGFGMTPQGFYSLGTSTCQTSFGSPGMDGGFQQQQQQQYGYGGGYDGGSFEGYHASPYSTPPASPLPPTNPNKPSPAHHPSPHFISAKTQPTDTVYFDSAGTPISSPSRAPTSEQLESLSMPPSVYGMPANYGSAATPYSGPHWNIYGSPQQQALHQQQFSSSPMSPLTQLQHMQHLQATAQGASPPTHIENISHSYVMPTQCNQLPDHYNAYPTGVKHRPTQQRDYLNSVPPPQIPVDNFNPVELQHQQHDQLQAAALSQVAVAQQQGYLAGYDQYLQYPLDISPSSTNHGFEKFYPGPPIQSVPGPEGLTGPDGCNLFVFHVPSSFTNLEMFYLFQPFGAIVSVRIMTEAGTGRGRGFGFVSFEKPHSAQHAIENLNGCQVGNKRLKVQYKERKSKDVSQDVAFNKKQITYSLNDDQYQDHSGDDSPPASACAPADTAIMDPPSTKPVSPISPSASLSTTGANASFSSISAHSVTSSSTSASKTSNDLSISPDRSSNENYDTKEELLAEDLKGLSVASPSPPQCGVDEQAMFGETSPHNVPLLTSTSTESTSSP